MSIENPSIPPLDKQKWPNLAKFDEEAELLQGNSSSEPSIENSVLDFIEKGGKAPEPTIVQKVLDIMEKDDDVKANLDLNKALRELSTEDEKLVSMEDINSISPRDSGLEEKFSAESLNPENKKLHDELPPKGKKMSERIFGLIYKIPGINRVVGRLEIAYNQSRIDKNQQIEAQMRNQMDELNEKIEESARTEKEIERLSSEIGNMGIKDEFTSTSLSASAKNEELTEKRRELEKKKEKIQDKLAEREKQTEIHRARIDSVADTLIEQYNETLKPMKEELEKLQSSEDELDLKGVASEAMHEEQEKELDAVAGKRLELMAALTKTGMSEKEIQAFGAIKSLEKLIVEGMEKIQKENMDMAAKRADVVAKIEKTKTKAGVYQGKVEYFENLKNNQKIEAETRSKIKAQAEKPSVGASGGFGGEARSREAVYEVDNRPDVGNFINSWNAFLTEKYGSNSTKDDFVKMDNFLRDTGLPRSARLDSKNFKNILGKYYKYAKIPTFSFKHNADEFFAKKIIK